ncbi:MAG TPA: hypothetical protein DEH11_14560 [Actinobacteria bacterium]|nr:hypothetical protein [Actinomycetota bacterium]
MLVDALLIRSLLVSALMHLIGPANWALPGWLDRILPRLAAEPGEAALPAAHHDAVDPAAGPVSQPAGGAAVAGCSTRAPMP